MDRKRCHGLTVALTGMGVLLLAVVGVLSIVRPAQAAERPLSGGTLTGGLAADIQHVALFQALGYEAFWAVHNMHSGLVRADAKEPSAVDELFQRWRTTIDATEHASATAELQNYLTAQLYQIGFANTPFFQGVREQVKGYWFVDNLLLNFETVWLTQ